MMNNNTSHVYTKQNWSESEIDTLINGWFNLIQVTDTHHVSTTTSLFKDIAMKTVPLFQNRSAKQIENKIKQIAKGYHLIRKHVGKLHLILSTTVEQQQQQSVNLTILSTDPNNVDLSTTGTAHCLLSPITTPNSTTTKAVKSSLPFTTTSTSRQIPR